MPAQTTVPRVQPLETGSDVVSGFQINTNQRGKRKKRQRRKGNQASIRGQDVFLSGPDLFEIDVVGESHYQEALEFMCGGKSRKGADLVVLATLTCEGNNPHDPNAVRVDIGKFTVGHLDRINAQEFRQRLVQAGAAGCMAYCRARIVGGWYKSAEDQGYFGVKLDLPVE